MLSSKFERLFSAFSYSKNNLRTCSHKIGQKLNATADETTSQNTQAAKNDTLFDQVLQGQKLDVPLANADGDSNKLNVDLQNGFARTASPDDSFHFVQTGRTAPNTANFGSAAAPRGRQSFDREPAGVADKWKKFLDLPADPNGVEPDEEEAQISNSDFDDPMKKQASNSSYDPLKKLLEAAEKMSIDNENRPAVVKKPDLFQKNVSRPQKVTGANSAPIRQKRY